MSIWVRSQCKRFLINANDIWILGTGISANTNTHTEAYTPLGAYASEAEALAVLDMIQNNVEAIEYFKYRPNSDMPCPPFVFQMPKASFLGGADDDRP